MGRNGCPRLTQARPPIVVGKWVNESSILYGRALGRFLLAVPVVSIRMRVPVDIARVWTAAFPAKFVVTRFIGSKPNWTHVAGSHPIHRVQAEIDPDML